nr:alpha/beta hydrolase [Candidatus Njordarchaeum guaymaensis]
MPKVRIKDTEIYYETYGKKEGDPLLLIHGLGGEPANWFFQIPPFSKEYRLVVPAVRGHGLSSKPKEGYSIRIFADDIIALLDKLNIKEKAFVCGVSMGGMIALQLTLEYPERVKGLILVSTHAFVSDKTKNIAGKWFSTYEDKGFDTYFDLIVKSVFTQSFLRSNRGIVSQMKELYRNQDVEAVGRAAFGLNDFDVKRRLNEIKVPTLVIHGEEDKLIPVEQGVYLKDHIKNAKWIPLHDAAHAALIEKTNEFNKAVLEFIRTVR